MRLTVAKFRVFAPVANKRLFFACASQAPRRDLAFFMRRRAELLAEYNRIVEPFTDFVDSRGLPLNRIPNGKVIAVAALDELARTK